MNRCCSTFVLLAALLWTSPATGDELRNVKVGQEVPPFTVSTLTGDTIRSAELRGRVLVIVYVAAEQKTSAMVTKHAHTVARELRDEELEVLYMTADVTRVGFFRSFRDQLNIHAPLGLDVARQVYGDLGLIVLPTTVIVDREGRLARVISSSKPDYEHVLRVCVEHTLGLIDDEELEAQLSARPVDHHRPAERVARHRAAARQLLRGGLERDAENELHTALEIVPGHADAQLDLASLYVAVERYEEADGMVDRVLAAQPDHRRGKLLRAVVLYHLDRLDQAEPLLEESLLLNTDPAWTHYYLGLVRERRGDQSAAIAHYRESLARLLRKEPM